MQCFGVRNVLVGALVVSSAFAAADLDLILYGADGCVGHFAASHLAQQPGLKWAIAGRTLAHLQVVAADLAKEGGSSSKPEIIVASLDGKSDPKVWVSRAKAVITAAGPFSVHGGELIVKACAESGVHYSDTSDEFYWQREMIDRHDMAAQKSGAKMVLSSGFCAMAGDLGAQLAMKSLGAAEGAQVDIDAWLETYNGGLSAGVINTGKAIANASFPKEWNDDPYVLVPNVAKADRVDTIVQGMSYPKWVNHEGLVIANIFGPYDARLLRRSFAHLGQKVQLRVGASAGMYPKWTAFLASHPDSWTKLAKCPTKTVYDDGAWSYRFKASSGDKSATVLLSGKKDPGYHFTAWGLAEAGLCLAGKTVGCMKETWGQMNDAGKTSGGIFPAMAALDASVLQQRLESIDLVKVEKLLTSDSDTLVV